MRPTCSGYMCSGATECKAPGSKSAPARPRVELKTAGRKTNNQSAGFDQGASELGSTRLFFFCCKLFGRKLVCSHVLRQNMNFKGLPARGRGRLCGVNLFPLHSKTHPNTDIRSFDAQNLVKKTRVKLGWLPYIRTALWHNCRELQLQFMSGMLSGWAELQSA